MADQLMIERRPPGLCIVISDFLTDPSDYEDALGRLAAARHEVKAIHVMGERERAGDYPGELLRVRDSETGALREVAMGPESIARYRERVEDFSRRLHDFCARHAITYVPAFGAGNFERVITQDFPRLGLVV
jgi:hypothetical protein